MKFNNLMICLLLTIFSTSIHAKVNILLTHFGPWGDSGNPNNSELIAYEIKEELKQINDDIELYICPLDVVFGVASQQAMDCLGELNPNEIDLVLSLGEGGVKIDLEIRAHNENYCGNMPDNAGNSFPVPIPIIDGEAKEHGLNLPLQAMYCSLSDNEQLLVNFSIDPGGFVCNNTAYLLSKKIPAHIPYGFIHVPLAADVDFLDYLYADVLGRHIDNSVLGDIIAKMVNSAAAFVRTDSNGEIPLPHPKNQFRWPVDLFELQVMRDRVTDYQNGNLNNCYQELFSKIERTF